MWQLCWLYEPSVKVCEQQAKLPLRKTPLRKPIRQDLIALGASDEDENVLSPDCESADILSDAVHGGAG